MSDSQVVQTGSRATRREFLRTGSALAAAGAFAGTLSVARTAHAAGSDVLKIGLVGCGGRGTGAAVNALNADKNCKLVALADAFSDRLESSLEAIKGEVADKVAVDPDHCFVGFDAGKRLIASDVDVVILAEPPHFRPAASEAADRRRQARVLREARGCRCAGRAEHLGDDGGGEEEEPEYRFGAVLAV